MVEEEDADPGAVHAHRRFDLDGRRELAPRAELADHGDLLEAEGREVAHLGPLVVDLVAPDVGGAVVAEVGRQDVRRRERREADGEELPAEDRRLGARVLVRLFHDLAVDPFRNSSGDWSMLNMIFVQWSTPFFSSAVGHEAQDVAVQPARLGLELRVLEVEERELHEVALPPRHLVQVRLALEHALAEHLEVLLGELLELHARSARSSTLGSASSSTTTTVSGSDATLAPLDDALAVIFASSSATAAPPAARQAGFVHVVSFVTVL